MLLGIAITLLSLWFGQHHGLMPVAASREAELVDDLFNVMMTIGIGLFLLVEGALIVAAIRFRRKPGDETDGEHLEGNIPLEILWTAIPAVIVLGISLYSFEIYTEMGGLNLMNHNHGSAPKAIQVAYAPTADGLPLLAAAGLGNPPTLDGMASMPDITIDVTGLQYAFIFTYPDSGIVDGELHIPTGQQVQLNLKAQDVLHAFWLPEFRVKQDMIPGEDTTMVIEATREGTYPVVCAELCGPYHGGMRTQLIAHSPEDYQAWVQSRVAQGGPDAETVLASLPSQARNDAEYLNHFVDPLQLDVDAHTLAELRHPMHQHSMPGQQPEVQPSLAQQPAANRAS
jgi:cytochrome c oxidase subunit 2